MKPPQWIILFIITFAVGKLSAATNRLSYNDCLEKILKTNKEIQLAQLDEERFSHSKASSYSGFLPELKLDSSYTDTHLTNESTSKRIYSHALTLNQNIFSGFQDYLKLSVAEFEKTQAQNNLTKEKINQRAELKMAFANLMLAKRINKYFESLVKTRESIRDLVSLKFSSGNETKDSLLFAEGEIESARLDLLTSGHAILSSQRKLERILGEELGEVELVGDIPIEEIPSDIDFKQASMESFDFQNALLSEKKEQESLRSAKGKFLPSVDFSISREREKKRNYSETSYNRNYYTIYELSVTFPLFAGFSTYHEMKNAEIDAGKEKINAVKVYEEQFSLLKDVYESYQELQKKKKIYQQFVEAAKMKEKINTAKYRLGLVTFDTWIDAQNALIDYEKNLIEIDYEIEVNLAKWQALVAKRV